MLRAMVFIDYENFDIAKYGYFRDLIQQGLVTNQPRVNITEFSEDLVSLLSVPHTLVKTFMFVPQPDMFLKQDQFRLNKYLWLDSLKRNDYITIIEGQHLARPTNNAIPMDINDRSTYYITEKGTDVNLATHVLTKAFMNAYDTAIIVSGDTDYIPVTQVLNTIGKTVVIVGIQTQNLFKYKAHTDQQILLDSNFFTRWM